MCVCHLGIFCEECHEEMCAAQADEAAAAWDAKVAEEEAATASLWPDSPDYIEPTC